MATIAFLEPSPQLGSFALTTTNNARSSAVTLLSLPTQKISTAVKSKISESTASHENFQQSSIQELVDLLHDYAQKGSIRETKVVHCYVLKSNFLDENLSVLLNHVAHAYSKCSDITAARVVFDNMCLKNVFSWTVMIVGSAESGHYHDAFKYFCEMQDCGIFPDKFAYSAIIQLCVSLDCVDLGKMVHAQIIIRGFASHVFVSTSVLNMYAKLGKVKDSCQVFNNMAEHNEVSWNAMISGLTRNGFHLEAFNHFLTMVKEGFSPNKFSLVGVLKAIGKLGDAAMGKKIHKYVSKFRMESDVFVGTALIDMYSRCGALSDARSVFDVNFITCGLNMPWNAMISGYLQCGCSQEALEFYLKMCQNDMKSDLYTYCSVFKAIADMKCLQFAREVHGILIKTGCEFMALSVRNAIADAYSKCGSLEDVRKVFDRMEERDIVSWTILLAAHSQCSEWQEALAIFSQMRQEGFTPNQFTFTTILDASACLCFLEYGRQVHALIWKAGLNTDRCIESALIDMYAKCGCIGEAVRTFDSIFNPDIVSWTTIISAYAQHGFVSDALERFKRMDQLGIKANAVTMLCVLFACSHGGKVEEGLHYFELMEGRYSLVPEMEHYACIVDLLGRVGRLSDALEFIREMPIEPNEMVWQTLLGACRVYGNAELGELAAKKIISTCPEDSAAYVLLSNTYMQIRSSRSGHDLRNVMKERGVKKDPGYSWISIGGRVHKFYAQDQEHPGKYDIYLMLEELREKIKGMGYAPDLRYALEGHF